MQRESTIIVCALALIGVLTLPAGAEDWKSVRREFGREMGRLNKVEKAFWKQSYASKSRAAHVTYEKEWLENWGLPTGKKEVHYDFTGYRGLMDEYLGLIEERCAAIAELAGHGEDGMELLYKSFQSYLGEAQKREAALRKARAVQASNIYDQRTGMELAGLDRLLRALLQAMAKTHGDEAVAYLAGQYDKAAKADGKHHDVRLRDVILQVLGHENVVDAGLGGKSKSEETLFQRALADRNIAMRVAAVEAISRLDETDATRALLLEHLREEKAAPVVMAALDTWAQGRWSSSKAIPALIELFTLETDGAAGILRAHYMEALESLTGVDQGLNPANWAGWMATQDAAIRDGSYQKPDKEKKKKDGAKAGEEADETEDHDETEEADETESESDDVGDEATVTFFDIKSLSKSVVFLVDASDTLMLPADISIAKTKAYWEWRTGNKKQMEGLKTQLDRLIEECEKTMKGLHPTCKFNVVLMMQDYRKMRFQPQLVPATKANKQRAIAFLKNARPSGWASQLSGLRDAMEMGGMSCDANEFDRADVDTVFLLSDGVPCGGWWMDSREVVRSFRRDNRFRRLTVHTIRIANEPEADAEYLMAGIAAASGGTYVWLTE